MFKPSRTASRTGLENLRLPAHHVATLRVVAAQRRGVVLLTGPTGAGKTQAAEVLASALGLDLLRVDLARVVGRYVGETEKNLDRLFAAAAGSDALLLFDEADALFGQRTEVKDAHDRYANLEVGYLLQKIEAHRGPVILAAHRRQGIDPALLRRLRHVVEFPWPPKPA